jgi:hypothetical protein
VNSQVQEEGAPKFLRETGMDIMGETRKSRGLFIFKAIGFFWFVGCVLGVAQSRSDATLSNPSPLAAPGCEQPMVGPQDFSPGSRGPFCGGQWSDFLTNGDPVRGVVEAPSNLSPFLPPGCTAGPQVSKKGTESEMAQHRRDGGIYQSLYPNWVSNLHPLGTRTRNVAEIRTRFRTLVDSRIAEPTVDYGTPWYAKIRYKKGFLGLLEDRTVTSQRLAIVVTDGGQRHRTIVAYFLNSDHSVPGWPGPPDEKKARDILFLINGHFIPCPSQQEMGLLNYSPNYSGQTVAKLALLGYPVITFDDRDTGESTDDDQSSRPGSPTTKGPVGQVQGAEGLINVLADIRAVEKALLAKPGHNWRSVHAVGVSGGGQRVALYLLSNRLGSVLKSAYIALPETAFWMELDNKQCSSHSNWDFDHDIFDFDFMSNFEYSDAILSGLTNGTRIAFAMNKREGGYMKNWFLEETVPTIRDHYRIPIWTNVDDKPLPAGRVLQVRGDDPKGIGDNSKGLCHQYDVDDYLNFLRSSGMPMNDRREYDPASIDSPRKSSVGVKPLRSH